MVRKSPSTANPDWVFKDLGQPVEERNFRYEDIIYPPGQRCAMGNALVPDESRMETQLWFYYQAASYIDVGCEGIHFGQVEIMNRNDHGNTNWFQLISKVREYATKHARRHMVLCNGHVPTGGLMLDGNPIPLTRLGIETVKTFSPSAEPIFPTHRHLPKLRCFRDFCLMSGERGRTGFTLSCARVVFPRRGYYTFHYTLWLFFDLPPVAVVVLHDLINGSKGRTRKVNPSSTKPLTARFSAFVNTFMPPLANALPVLRHCTLSLSLSLQER